MGKKIVYVGPQKEVGVAGLTFKKDVPQEVDEATAEALLKDKEFSETKKGGEE